MSTVTNLGRVGLMPAGAYSSTKAYKRGDIVSYTDGNSYVALVDNTGAALSDGTKWKI